LSLSGSAPPQPYLRTPAIEADARVSPDNRWLAFASTETGSPEIYIAPIDDPGGKRRVSNAGGSGPRWRSDGRELVYLDADNTFMSVALPAGQDLRPGIPRALFSPGRVFKNQGPSTIDPFYDIAPDAESFLVNRLVEDPDLAPITLVLNWPASLGK
jgi:dipeptidyl aminopeptidase/acylaminoacyl peptidase